MSNKVVIAYNKDHQATVIVTVRYISIETHKRKVIVQTSSSPFRAMEKVSHSRQCLWVEDIDFEFDEVQEKLLIASYLLNTKDEQPRISASPFTVELYMREWVKDSVLSGVWERFPYRPIKL